MSKTLRSSLALAAAFLIQMPMPGFAGETIYILTADDGSVSLSNVPTSRRYKPLALEGAGAGNGPAAGERRTATLESKARYDAVVDQTARTYGVDSALLHAVISVESGYDPAARSRKGAAGLMQLMPATAKRYGVADVLDPWQNLQGGARYLRDLLKQFNSDLNLVLAAYNAGEKAVADHGNRVPPFRETTEYVPRVLAYYRKYQADGRVPD